MKKILIIEDDNFLRELIADKLTQQGFQVIEAIDGQEGLDICQEQKPDLIILDLILPTIDGFEVLKIIKQDPQLSSIPVLILSNLGRPNEIKKGLDLGAKDYMVKSNFTLSEILNKVTETISQSQT